MTFQARTAATILAATFSLVTSPTLWAQDATNKLTITEPLVGKKRTACIYSESDG
jgi:hypothetical protein